jgi:ketosteroid isomerase-like protein
MTDRNAIEILLRGLYAARARGDLDGMCAVFADDADFRIAGASHASPIAIGAKGLSQIRPWLGLMVKTFQISELAVVSLIVEGDAAAAHWQANIHSRVTGAVVPTELVDLVRVRDGRIGAYTEFFVPR